MLYFYDKKDSRVNVILQAKSNFIHMFYRISFFAFGYFYFWSAVVYYEIAIFWARIFDCASWKRHAIFYYLKIA